MEISKSTPYVRYRENISSTLHKGTIHIESEYLDRERKTTIESIEGQTWQNMVNGENKEEDILPRLGLKIEGNEDILDSEEQHMPIDTIIGDVEPVANEDGTYTYEISTIEGSYAKTLDGENNFSLTSDGLVGDMYIKYNAQGEEVNGSIVMDNWQSNYTIENSNIGEIKSAILKGNSKKVVGKNKCNMEEAKLAWIDGKTGIENSGGGVIIPVEVAGTITISNYISTNNRYVYEYDVNNNYLGRKSIRTDTVTLTLKESTVLIKIGFYDRTLEDIKKLNLQVELGDAATDYEPYNPTIVSVKMPVLTTTGKNLYNGYEKGSLNASTGLVDTTKSNECSVNFIYIRGQKRLKTNLTARCIVLFYDINKEFVDTGWNEYGNASPTINVPSGYDLYYMRIKIRAGVITDAFKERTDVMVVRENDDLDSYEPHKSNILTTPSDVELRRIGDVQDTLDCLTGEVTERIGEIVLDGSQNMDADGRGIYIQVDDMKKIEDYRTIITCDKLPVFYHQWDLPNVENGISGYRDEKNEYPGQNWLYIKINNSIDVDEVRQMLIQNPITVLYELATPIIKTVDLIIKDQDNKIIQSLHTHPSTTHINLSSDGLIPNAEINYTMYGNIGETTGEKITDGTDSKLIEGKVYGDTLLNVLPSPSLKNSMDYNTSMQKLNNGYDNINVADGEFKKATLYGKMLVNLVQPSLRAWTMNLNSDTASLKATMEEFIIDWSKGVPYNAWIQARNDNSPVFGGMLKADTDYTFIIRILENNPTFEGVTVTGDIANFQIWGLRGYEPVRIALRAGVTGTIVLKCKFNRILTTLNIENMFAISVGGTASNGTKTIDGGKLRISKDIIVIEGDYTNNYQYIPYFEGMQSVVMPSLMTCGKNLFNKEAFYNDWKGKQSNYIYKEIVDNEEVLKINNFHHLYTDDLGFRINVKKGVPLTVRMECKKAGTHDTNSVFTIRYDDKKYLDFPSCKSDEWVADTITFVPTRDYITFCSGYNYNDYYYVKNIQLEQGSTATPYESHKSNTLTLNEPIELRAIGDVRDELDCLTGELTQRIGEIVLDGSQTLQPHSIDQGDTLMIKISDPSISFKQNSSLQESWDFSDMICDKEPIGETPKWDASEWNKGYNIALISSAQTTYDINSFVLAIRKSYFNVQSIDGFKTWLTQNPLTIQYKLAKESIKTVDISITNQDSQPQTVLHSFANGYINVTSQGSLPKVDYEVPSSNSYYLDTMVKPNTQYTTKSSSDCNATIDGTSYPLSANGTFTTPSTITDKLMVLDAQVDDLMFIEGDLTGRKLDYFTGMQSVDMPILTISNEDRSKTNILTTNEPIALHKIGDVKDELDLVNECVVRRIGKVVLDGSENWTRVDNSDGTGRYYYMFNEMRANSDIISPSLPTVSLNNNGYGSKYCVCSYTNNVRFIFIYTNHGDVNSFKQWLSENNVELYYQSQAPTTEPVRIVPQNSRQSTVSLTLQSPLQKVGNVSDQLRWNPYKGHYVRYNYIQDGVANSTYTFEDLKDMNERKFVNLYNQRTYIDTDHTVQVISHGLSRYCLAEQGKQYQIRWDWIEQPSVDTIKVDLCGNVKEIPSSDNSVIIDVEKFAHQFIQIQGLGLIGKITNLMVIETVNGETPDVDFFSGIQCVGNTVSIEGNTKVQIDMEQTNGNLLDGSVDNLEGKSWRTVVDVKPNQNYSFNCKALNNETYSSSFQIYIEQYNDNTKISSLSINSNSLPYNFTTNNKTNNIKFYTSHVTDKGNLTIHRPIELCYADMAKDGIRPRYYDKESIILPMKLCRVGNIYDNLYYDDLKGYYRIQQSIGHKYFTGETTEVWTMETTDGYRTIKFTCTSANIDQIAYGGTICNQWKHLSTINDDIEGFIIYNGNFVLRIDKDRLTDKTVDGFKALLASSPIHLFYQLKTPQMINLTEYPNRIEFNTYRDEIFTFFKGMNPTKFTLSVPIDKTYRYEIAEEGQGLANRVAVNNETISAENMVAVKEVRGQGIANIIEDVDNVVITPRPNYSGIATSHTLNNTKPATIRVHGFEASGETAVANYNVTDKAYQLKVMSSNGDNSLSDYYVLNVPYKLETYADGTKDMVYYDEAYKQWHFKGLSVKNYTAASDGMLNETVEVFRGLAPRSGMIVEFKLMFTSGTTTARFSYSTNGVTYNSLSLRGMSDGNYLYVAFFNTGGTKIDMARKTDPNAEYELLSFLPQVPECLMVNQIQNCEFCEVTINKQYIYSEMNSPIELDTYDGSTKVFMDGNATDTNIIIRNDATTKIVNTYTDTEYTVYWKYVDGLGNLRITLGGTTVEVDGKQEYATIKTQLNAPQELLYVGGYNLSIKDLMVVKGAKIDDLPYFEGSRQVGTLVLDEEGNKSYKITLVQGGSVLEQRDEDAIAFKDDNKHNVVVHKIVGVCPTKVD